MTKSQKLLLTAAVLSIALWGIPIARYLILPLEYLNTHFHELAHAIMALATGGQPDYIIVNADGSGSTPVSGGSIFLIASAGYPGTAILGSLLILAGRTTKNAQSILKTLAIILALSLLLLIRGDIVGVISALIWIPALWFASIKLKAENLQLATQFLGVQMCLTSFHSFLLLLNSSLLTNSHSDAYILQERTFIPDYIWAAGWTLFSLIIVIMSLKIAWSPVRIKDR
ncbi:MAG: M50 family metallopeptidase [Fimbriimonadaceae bacterium]